METTQVDRGQIITFYSYKGGVGRSMAVANAACLLSAKLESSRKQILIMDWDLEAPGLHRYFSARCDLPDFRDKPGVIDYFYQLRSMLDNAPELYEQLRSDQGYRILDEHLPLSPFLIPDVVPGVDFIQAGRFDEKYARKVGTFDWITFFDEYCDAIRAFRELLVEQYSLVLIDSRTGVTDVSAICTALLPEKLVGVFVPNRQNIDGLKEIVKQSISYRANSNDFRPMSVFPLPSRIENAEQVLKDQWRRDYQREFEDLFRHEYQLAELDLTSYFDKVLLPYVSFYAYGENIAVLREASDEISLSAAYQRFCERLITLAFPWETFEGAQDLVTASTESRLEPVRFEYDAYFAYAASDESLVLNVFRSLSARGIKCFLQWRDVVPGEKLDVITFEAMQKSRYILLFIGQTGVTSWQDQRQLNLLESFSKDGTNRVIPLFLPDTPSTATLRTPFLRNIHAINMKTEDDQVAVEYLSRIISPNSALLPVEPDIPSVALLPSVRTEGLHEAAPSVIVAKASFRRNAYFGVSLGFVSLAVALMALFTSKVQRPYKDVRTTPVSTVGSSGTVSLSSSSSPNLPSNVQANYVLGNVVAVTIHVASTRDPRDANKAAEVLRAHGYVVKGITPESLDQAPHETTVRYFQYDKSTVSTGKALVKLLQAMGFVVRTEFDDEFVGKITVPDAGTYEFYLGSTMQSGAIGALLTEFVVDVPPGLYKGSRAGTYEWVASASGSWVENLNGKYVNTFEFSGREILDGCGGGVYQKAGSSSEKVFIPDMDCTAKVLKYSTNQAWQNVAQIKIGSVKAALQ